MKPFNTIGEQEVEAAIRAAKSYPLSGYIGSLPIGGRQCFHLENEWAQTFKVKHAVAVNSATSGLLAACMAIGVEHGTEVIVSPYTMSATAAAPKLLGANVVFADIEPETFCLDPVEVANAITRKTKAVIVTNLFGHPAQLAELKSTCDQHGVYLIEDNAQAIFAKEYDRFAGTIGHIGVFSLNVHKHLQVGEGGICVTNNNVLAVKLREAMNHGEIRGGILGLNLRMTEIVAAMARQQLNKASEIMAGRWKFAERVSFEVAFAGLPIDIPAIRQGCTHSFYVWAGLMQLALRGEVPYPFKQGYLRPLYHLPAFRAHEDMYLPVVEEVEHKIIVLEICSIDPTEDEVKTMVAGLGKAL